MNYKIDAIIILLNQDWVLERYFPLIPFKDELVKIHRNFFKESGCQKAL